MREGNVLVRRGEGATDLRGRRLRLIHRDRGAQRAHAEPAHEPADRELLPRVGGSDLYEDADHEDATLHAHRVPPA